MPTASRSVVSSTFFFCDFLTIFFDFSAIFFDFCFAIILGFRVYGFPDIPFWGLGFWEHVLGLRVFFKITVENFKSQKVPKFRYCFF